MRKYVIIRKTEAVVGTTRGMENTSVHSGPSVVYERLTDQDAAKLTALPEVEAIAPSMAIKLIRPFQGSSSASRDVWGLQATGAAASGFSGEGVLPAILDTGIDCTHPAFAGVELEEEDFTGQGNGDVVGHGTHCAGTVFGRDVDGLRIGVARGIKKALIGKVLDDDGGGDIQMLENGINWAVRRGANIISMSLGFDFPGMVKSWIEEGWPADLAASNALEAYRVNLRVLDGVMSLTKPRGGLHGGALVVAASGNESKREQHRNWRIAASLPAANDEVVAVAAVGRHGDGLVVANFSNSAALLSGPGVDVVSAKTGGGLDTLSGTSMACPHMAGLAALWWDAIRRGGRTPTALNVRAALIGSARREAFAGADAEVDIGQGLATAP